MDVVPDGDNTGSLGGLCIFSCAAVLATCGAIASILNLDIGPESTFFAVSGIGGLCFAKCQYLRVIRDRTQAFFGGIGRREDAFFHDNLGLPRSIAFGSSKAKLKQKKKTRRHRAVDENETSVSVIQEEDCKTYDPEEEGGT